MSEQCALCTRRDATTRLKDTGILGTLLRQETRLDIPEREIVIPLCNPCTDHVSEMREDYRYGGPDEKIRAGERLTRDAKRMNVTTVRNASGH